VVAQLLASGDKTVQVWLGGDLLPDQVSLAFQCGIDAVLVSEENWTKRGELAWMAALNPPVKLTYRADTWSQLPSISELRKIS